MMCIDKSFTINIAIVH